MSGAPGVEPRAEEGKGDLEERLRQAGLPLTLADVRSIAEGVASAPAGADADVWITLLGPVHDEALRAQLRQLLAETRTARARERREDGVAVRLARFRAELRGRRLAGFIIPRGDEHQGEQVPPGAERLLWLSGFSGSAGTAAVLRDRAALFVDGRYTEQARAETAPSLWEIRHAVDEPLGDWLAEHLRPRSRLGYDAWLHTPVQVAGYRRACRKAGARLVTVSDNPVDAIWADRPPPPIAPVVPQPETFTGRASHDKRRQIAETLQKDRQNAAVLSAPDSIAWLLNVRGGDVPYAPLPLAFAIIAADGKVELFIDPRKLAPGLGAHLGDHVRVLPPTALGPALDRLAGERRTVRLEKDSIPEWVDTRLRRAGAQVVDGADPCALPKATKTAVELEGIRAAHRRDGVALVRFLAWLDAHAGSGRVTEMAAADRLLAFRREGARFRGPSFATISAAGDHGAIVHYRVAPATDRPLAPGSLYLVDSGGQYLDGTTDVTRTVAVGTPTEEARDRFTRVLKGHIAIATATFPKGTTGPQLDTLARLALWRAGLDYDHGTGHGVGCYLSVHEGPQRIAKLPNRIALAPGMVVSNEPGYYKPGAFGIRIENLVAVTPAKAPPGSEKEMLGFQTLTIAPIDLRLVEAGLLTHDEVAWLDGYHAVVRERLMPLVDRETAGWVEAATRPVRG